MGNKSKRNRRPISSRPASNPAANVTAVDNKPVSTASVKQVSVESFITTSNFVRDLKWTGIVTLIIAVLIIVALYTVPR